MIEAGRNLGLWAPGRGAHAALPVLRSSRRPTACTPPSARAPEAARSAGPTQGLDEGAGVFEATFLRHVVVPVAFDPQRRVRILHHPMQILAILHGHHAVRGAVHDGDRRRDLIDLHVVAEDVQRVGDDGHVIAEHRSPTGLDGRLQEHPGGVPRRCGAVLHLLAGREVHGRPGADGPPEDDDALRRDLGFVHAVPPSRIDAPDAPRLRGLRALQPGERVPDILVREDVGAGGLGEGVDVAVLERLG
mmetsp:Transcript_98816/g.285195  ORF Transcript_98816/g.285195 Transcript_98816/m.285195 type:complete len:247 (+) Transcript_98816:124-864(+)